MKYRKLEAGTDDYSFGRGRLNFWIDVPEAPAQAVLTRVRMWQGEWYMDRGDGTPYLTLILGKRTNRTRDVAVKSRILGTPGVVGPLVQYGSQIQTETRDFSFNALVNTTYSTTPIYVSSPIGDPP